MVGRAGDVHGMVGRRADGRAGSGCQHSHISPSPGRHSGTCTMMLVVGLRCHGGPDITRQVRLVDHPRPPARFAGSLFLFRV